jgi:hypothetical protein
MNLSANQQPRIEAGIKHRRNKNMRLFICICLFFVFSAPNTQGQDRGSIPEELLRPRWNVSPHYPADIVIGDLGQGKASDAAYSYANSIASAILSRQRGHPSLASVNPDLLDSYFYALGRVAPVSFRLGGGREEADGAISFLIRYIGRDYGITGELYIRYRTRQIQGEDGEITQTGNWVFDDLLFEEAKSHEQEFQESMQRAEKHRLNYLPYERFF